MACRSRATPRRRTRARASAPGRSSTPAARTRPTPPSSRSPGRAARARSTASSACCRRRCSPTSPNNCDGQVVNDAGRPAGALADGAWPADPYPNPDPERHAFQIRLTVHELGDASNFGRYRKTLFAYRDDGNLAGWPQPVGSGSVPARLITGSGGETSPRLYDVNGDNALDVLLPTSSGELYALNADGTPVQSFNGGQPVLTEKTALAKHHDLPASLPAPREPLRVPAIGDINGDREAEIVATAGEHIYAWNLDGSPVPGFPVRIEPALSDPCKPGAPHPCFNAADRAITSQNHIKRGFFGSPALADLNGDGRLDIVAGSLDQHVYAFDGTGAPLAGWPVKLSSPGADGAEIVTSPAIADLNGDGKPEVVIATNEVVPGDPQLPSSVLDLLGQILASGTGSNPVYALHGNGTPVSGWPVTVGVAAGDLLPLVLPGHDAAVLDTNGDGKDEVSVSAGTGFGGRIVDGSGATVTAYQNAVADCPDQGLVLNLADYPSIGDLAGNGTPDVIKGGGTVNLAANLLAVNQNLPFCHVEQAWNSSTGAAVPGYPRATDDFQLVSQSSVARVSGAAPAHQALVGTGMYQLHAYGPDGSEAAGWPKFTGGWLEATAAVGDANGDGKLDVTTVSREGWAFLWYTDVPACGGSNDEWCTWHHDEHSSANYGVDGRPPGSPRALKAKRKGKAGAVGLSWKAPGDDWLCGTAAHYQVIASDGPDPSPGRRHDRGPGGLRRRGRRQRHAQPQRRRPRLVALRSGALPRRGGQLGAASERQAPAGAPTAPARALPPPDHRHRRGRDAAWDRKIGPDSRRRRGRRDPRARSGRLPQRRPRQRPAVRRRRRRRAARARQGARQA